MRMDSPDRQQRWYQRHGHIVAATELFAHGCGPVEVTSKTVEGKFHRNWQDVTTEARYSVIASQMQGVPVPVLMAQLMGLQIDDSAR